MLKLNKVNSLEDGKHRDQHRLSVLEGCPAHREFRYSGMTENQCAGTYTSHPSYRGVR